MKKTLSRIGEFGLIDLFRKMTRTPRGIIGIGDDTAVLPKDKKKYELLTTDMLIEGRHFRLGHATPFEIGWKALAVNLSDIAAMGGLPRYAVVAVGLPRRLDSTSVLDIYRGMQAIANKFDVFMVGGDTNRAETLVISVTVLGEVEKNYLTLRSGARLGDTIFVTGALGGSYPSKKHLRFMPRIREARFLVKNFNIHSMMDLSDGLGSDIFRLTRASGVGASLVKNKIPISRHAKTLRNALNDGEDFELLFTASSSEERKILASGLKIKAIGKIVKKREGVYLVDGNGQKKAFKEAGYRHF